jgi:hypothetical protein
LLGHAGPAGAAAAVEEEDEDEEAADDDAEDEGDGVSSSLLTRSMASSSAPPPLALDMWGGIQRSPEKRWRLPGGGGGVASAIRAALKNEAHKREIV